MKLILLKDNLKEALQKVERVVSDQNTLPILKNVLIKTDQNKVILSATNLEIAVTSTSLGKILESGAITVPFAPFASIIQNCDSERIQFESEGKTLKVKTDNYEAKLQGIGAEEFPIIPSIEKKDKSIEFQPGVFKNAILDIVSAAQPSEIRPEISGVLFDFQVGMVKLVATDSFRLGEKTIHHTKFKTNFTQNFKIIIPLKTVHELIRIFPEDKEVSLYVDPHQLLMKTNEVELISRLVDGEYPDYEQIVPRSIETEITLPRISFINAIKLVSTLSGKVNDIKFRVKEGQKAVEIYSANQQVGENTYLIPAKIQGEECKEITFNWRYLLDGLKPVKSEHFNLGVNGDTKPAILRVNDDTTYYYIVMPIKQ